MATDTMDTAGATERSRAPRGDTAGRPARDRGHDIPAAAGRPGTRSEPSPRQRALWIEEPARRRRMPDPVRESAVRAVLVIAVTMLLAMVAFFCTMAGTWSALPLVVIAIASTVAATWAVLDVWVTRQVWNQRNGVVSAPSSTARARRRERRVARAVEREEKRELKREQKREQKQIRAQQGQLSHP